MERTRVGSTVTVVPYIYDMLNSNNVRISYASVHGFSVLWVRKHHSWKCRIMKAYHCGSVMFFFAPLSWFILLMTCLRRPKEEGMRRFLKVLCAQYILEVNTEGTSLKSWMRSNLTCHTEIEESGLHPNEIFNMLVLYFGPLVRPRPLSYVLTPTVFHLCCTRCGYLGP